MVTESLETRLLLSATNNGDDYAAALAASSDEFAQATTTFQSQTAGTSALSNSGAEQLAAASSGPLGNDIADFEAYYSQFGIDADAQLDQSIDQAIEQQQDQSQNAPSGTGADVDATATGDAESQQITSSSQSLLVTWLSGNSSGTTSTDSTSPADGSTSADSGPPNLSLFHSTADTQSLNNYLPVLQQEGSLFQVVPDGQNSFSTMTVVPSEISETTDAVNSSPVTIITLEQTYVSPDDWVVHQSWQHTTAGSPTSLADSEDGTDSSESGDNSDSGDISNSGDEDASGSEASPQNGVTDWSDLAPSISSTETYSVTVINGTTTIRTWTKSGSFSLRAGTLADDGVDDGAEDDELWTVPDAWVAAAGASVNDASEYLSAPSGNSDTAAETTPGSENSSGLGFSVSGMISLTLTEVLVTMEDGSPGTQRTMALTWSGAVHLGIEGAYSINQSDLQQTLGDDAEPLPDGLTVDVGGSFQLWAKASVAASVTATVTVPDGGLLSFLGSDFEASVNIGVSAAAGGSLKSHEKLNLDQTSGNIEDQTDEFEKVHVDNWASASGIVGLEFWVVASTADQPASESDTSDDSSQTSGDENDSGYSSGSDATGSQNNGSDGTGEDHPPTTLVPANSGIGTRSAATLTEGKGSGIQFSFEMNGSYKSVKDEQFGVKQRSELLSTAVAYHVVEEGLSKDVADTFGDVHFVVALGTERMAIGFSVNARDSSISIEDQKIVETWSPGEAPPTDQEVLYGIKRYRGQDQRESSFSFGLALGADATGQPGDALHYQSKGKGFSEGDLTFVARVENYLNSPGDTYPWVERDFERHEWDYKTGLGIPEVLLAGSAQLAESEVGTQALPEVPAVKLVSIPPGSGDLQQLLDEYRARAINIARWQAQLAVTNDPELRTYIQGRIAAEQKILATIAAQAIAAGATPQQLEVIAEEAVEAADNDPVDLEDFDGGESTTGAYWYGMFFDGNYLHYLTNPSEMDDGLETGFYGALGTAGVALSLAGGLAAWPVIAEFGAAEFVLPTLGFGGPGLALVGGGSTGGTIIGGGTITGSQILSAAGLASITALFMTNEQIGRIADHVSSDHPDRYPGRSSGELQSRIHEILNNFSESQFGANGRQIWRLGKDILINDGNGAGTMFQPGMGAAAYIVYWLRQEFGF